MREWGRRPAAGAWEESRSRKQARPEFVSAFVFASDSPPIAHEVRAPLAPQFFPSSQTPSDLCYSVSPVNPYPPYPPLPCDAEQVHGAGLVNGGVRLVAVH